MIFMNMKISIGKYKISVKRKSSECEARPDVYHNARETIMCHGSNDILGIETPDASVYYNLAEVEWWIREEEE